MTDEFEISAAAITDSEEIARLERECFAQPWSEKAVADEISAENSVFTVCRFHGRIVGYVSGRDNCGEFYINNIAVTAEFRKNGIGEALFADIISEAAGRGCEFLSLEVRESNTAARLLYEKCGLCNVGKRKKFYRSPTEDAVLYTIYFNKSEKQQ